MRLTLTILTFSILALVISACGTIVGPTAQEMTLAAQNQSLGTQIADLRATATVEVDRMMITVEHAETEVRAVVRQRDALRATMIARGTDPGFLDVTQPEAGDLPPGIDPNLLLPQATPGAAPPITPGAPVDPNAAPLDPNALPTPTSALPPTTGPRLENVILATGVGSDDCATDNVTTFPNTIAEIYVVATARDFPAETTVTARWSREGTVMGAYNIPFNFEITNACIWAFIDQTDFVFTPGTWTVELDINGTPATAPLTFTISDAGGGAAESDEMGTEDGG